MHSQFDDELELATDNVHLEVCGPLIWEADETEVVVVALITQDDALIVGGSSKPHHPPDDEWMFDVDAPNPPTFTPGPAFGAAFAIVKREVGLRQMFWAGSVELVAKDRKMKRQKLELVEASS